MAGPDRILIGRVVESRDVVVFEGSVALQYYAHAVEPRDAPGTRTTVVAPGNLCPVPGDLETTYQMSLREENLTYGIRNEEDRSWMPHLVIASCAPVGSP